MVYPFLNNLAIFRQECFINFLTLIPISDALEIVNKTKSLPDEALILLFNTNNPLFQREAIKRIKKPEENLLRKCLKSTEKDVRMIALSKIIALRIESVLNDLITEIQKEEFLNKDIEEKEKWILAASLLGKNLLEQFFLSYFERKSNIFTPNIEERKIWAAKALKIMGTEKSLPYLQNEAGRFSASHKLKEVCKKAIEDIKRRCKLL